MSIATVQAPLQPPSLTQQQAAFRSILPRIELHAVIYFRHTRCLSSRDEQVAETKALAWLWFQRLARRGRNATQFASALATFAARAVQSGRRLNGQEESGDVLSLRAQKQHGFRVEALPSSTAREFESLFGRVLGQRLQDEFEERLHDNTVTPPDEQAAFRIDFPNWLRRQTARDRKLIAVMAGNERTKDLSRRFGLSPARISQLRSQFKQDWEQFGALPEEIEERPGQEIA